MPVRKRHRFLAVAILILVVAGVCATNPWAFHIGGRWTPLLTWWGAGTLVTKGGVAYPLYLSFHPGAHFSRLRRDGLRPTGGVAGTACLCTAPGVVQLLNLSGTIYDGWLSADQSLIGFRLLEPTILDVGQKRAGYFDLAGRWSGTDLVLTEGDAWAPPFRSGVRIERASVRLHWSVFTTCKSVCANTRNP